MGFLHVKFFLILVAVAVTLALQIAGAASPWYEINPQLGGDFKEYLTYMDSPVGECKYTDDCFVGDDRKAMYGIILACVIVGVVFTGLEALILLTWSFHACKKLKFRGKLRILLIILAVVATLATLAAWLVLFWHKDATKSDTGHSIDFFQDSNGIKAHPHAGWYLFLVASVLSICTTVTITMSGSPDHHGYMLFK